MEIHEPGGPELPPAASWILPAGGLRLGSSVVVVVPHTDWKRVAVEGSQDLSEQVEPVDTGKAAVSDAVGEHGLLGAHLGLCIAEHCSSQTERPTEEAEAVVVWLAVLC
jgi:hypothetical protein